MKTFTTYLSVLIFMGHVMLPVLAYGTRASAERVLYFLAYKTEAALMEMAAINGETYSPKIAPGVSPRFSGDDDFERFCKYIWAPIVPNPPDPNRPPQDERWRPTADQDKQNKVLPGKKTFDTINVGEAIAYVDKWVDKKVWNANKAEKKAKLDAMLAGVTDETKIKEIKAGEAYKKLEKSPAIQPRLNGASDSGKLWPSGGNYYEINDKIGDIIGDAKKKLADLKALPDSDPKKAHINADWDGLFKRGEQAAQAMVDLRVFDMDHPGKDPQTGNQRDKGFRQEFLDKDLTTKLGRDIEVKMKPIQFTTPGLDSQEKMKSATQIDFDGTNAKYHDVPDMDSKVRASVLTYATNLLPDGRPTDGNNHMRAYRASKWTFAGAMNQPKPDLEGCL